MFRSRWIRNLLNLARSRKVRRRLAAQSRKPIRLMLEPLEDRITPSGGDPTVTQTAGSYSQLTALIAGDTAANTNYIIQITGSFTFPAGGQVTISKLASTSTLTIEGQGGVNYTLTGNGNRLFEVIGATQNVTLDNLTLTGGSAANVGGAIAEGGGEVMLSGVTVRTNTATAMSPGPAWGGGIYVSGNGVLIVKDSTIENNVAQGYAGFADSQGFIDGGYAAGGGLFVFGGGVEIIDSTVSNNRAQGGAGYTPTTAGARASFGGPAAGGGIGTFLGARWAVILKGDILSGNVAVGGAGGNGAAGSNATGANHQGGIGGHGGDGGDAAGGGLYLSGTGAAIVLNDPSAPLTHPSILIDNSAIGGAAGKGGAGGKSTGSANNSSGGPGGNGGDAFGAAFDIAGGISQDTGPATIGNTTFYGNRAVGADGGAGGASSPLKKSIVPSLGEQYSPYSWPTSRSFCRA
jgi:hypothetical protein